VTFSLPLQAPFASGWCRLRSWSARTTSGSAPPSEAEVSSQERWTPPAALWAVTSPSSSGSLPNSGRTRDEPVAELRVDETSISPSEPGSYRRQPRPKHQVRATESPGSESSEEGAVYDPGLISPDQFPDSLFKIGRHACCKRHTRYDEPNDGAYDYYSHQNS